MTAGGTNQNITVQPSGTGTFYIDNGTFQLQKASNGFASTSDILFGISIVNTTTTVTWYKISQLPLTNASQFNHIIINCNFGYFGSTNQTYSQLIFRNRDTFSARYQASDTIRDGSAIECYNNSGVIDIYIKHILQYSAISIGTSAGQINQGLQSITIGRQAGNNTQGENAIAIGNVTAQNSQGFDSIAIGNTTAQNNQNSGAIAIGRTAGQNEQGTNSIAIGVETGRGTQGINSIAIGVQTGRSFQNSGAIAIGRVSGFNTQGTNAIAIGMEAGRESQLPDSIAIGNLAGQNTQGTQAIAIGRNAGRNTQGLAAIAIGSDAGQSTQGIDSVAIGRLAGSQGQKVRSVAIGIGSGQNFQGQFSVAIGRECGQTNQGNNAIAIGNLSGQINQAQNSIAIGSLSGLTNQGQNAISIGINAGSTTQGINAIAIGNSAGQTNQHQNSIILNASGIALNSQTQSAFYVNPIRNNYNSNLLVYDTSNSEITYMNNPFDLSGNLDLSCNLIQDVSGIYFCDGTYIGHGSSFDISSSEIIKINQIAIVVDTSNNVGIGRIPDPSYNFDVSGIFRLQPTNNLPTSVTPYGLYLNSPLIKTYPTTTSFRAYPAYYTDLELGTSQTYITTTGFNFIYGDYRNYTKSAGTTSDIERLYFNGFNQIFTWDDANTCKQYVSINDIFNYNGKDANSRTTASLNSNSISLNCPESSKQTISNIRANDRLIIRALNNDCSYNITNIYSPSLQFVGSGLNVIANITNHSFFENSINWNCNLTGAGSSATISNMYGLKLNPPTNQTGLTITNNWGVYSGWSSAKNYFAGGVGIGTTNPTEKLDVSGNITINNNLLMDVSGINFSDGTYIGTGNSFDISANQTLDITSNDNITIDPSNTLIVNGNLEVNELTTIKDDLVFVNNGNNIMSFSDFSSNTQNVQLPSIHSQPVSLTRVSLFYNDVSYTLTGPAGTSVEMPFGTIIKNQLNLDFSGNIISPSLDISGQYVELYVDVQINVGNNIAFELDISGVDCSFFEIIDFKETSKTGSYYLTFGPHIFIPEQWAGCSQIIFKLVNNGNNNILIEKTKTLFKSYYL